MDLYFLDGMNWTNSVNWTNCRKERAELMNWKKLHWIRRERKKEDNECDKIYRMGRKDHD
jgi:hypothetical protein